MKKITAVICAALLSFAVLPCAAEELSNGIFEYTSDGVITAYYGDEYAIVPSEIDGTPIKEIGEKAFFDLAIKSVFIEMGIEKIGKSAFEGCNAEYVEILGDKIEIGESAFQNCAYLADFAVNSNEVFIGENAFAGTGEVSFYIPCTANIDDMFAKFSAAKGNSDIAINVFHRSLVESMEEKDAYGMNMIYCEACGFKGSRFLDIGNVPFEDVTAEAWYFPYVYVAYTMGILNGKSETKFDPDAGLTCAEAAKIAACVYAYKYEKDSEYNFAPTGENWYDVYVNYCYNKGIIEEHIVFDWNKKATRAEMAYLFSRCSTSEVSDYINSVPLTDIPDVSDTTPFAYEIQDLYNKGIAVGSNDEMFYYPDSNVRRSEAAALVARMMLYDLRIELPKG